METSTTAYDHATFMFPSVDNSSRMALRSIMLSLESAARPLVNFQYIFSFFGIIITILHSIILTRKEMMTSSIIPIMIGIAFCDLFAMIATICSKDFLFDTEGTACTPPITLISVQIMWMFITIRDMARRCSTWLGVLMAVIRFMMIKYSMKPVFHRISKPKSGFHFVICTFLISCVFSIAYFFRYNFMEEGFWSPMKNCTDISLNTTLPVVAQKPSAFLTAYNGVFGKVYMFVNGILSKIVPCLLLPLLTVLLIITLHRVEEERKSSNPGRKTSERTTGLVIFMTVTFFLVELPLGISLVFQVAFMDMGYLYLATYVQHMVNALFIVNATTHCLVCFLMSTQYRLTVGKLLHIERNIVTMVKPSHSGNS